MSDYIKLTWSKLAIILVSMCAFVIGFAYCEMHIANNKAINDIEAVNDVSPDKAQV